MQEELLFQVRYIFRLQYVTIFKKYNSLHSNLFFLISQLEWEYPHKASRFLLRGSSHIYSAYSTIITNDLLQNIYKPLYGTAQIHRFAKGSSPSSIKLIR